MAVENNFVKLDTVVVGSGLSALNFIDTYSKKKKIDVISPNFNKDVLKAKNHNVKFLPSQMKGEKTNVNNYFFANNLENLKNSKIIGSLNFGGLSNYWGLQIDNFIDFKDNNIKKTTQIKIIEKFCELLKKYELIGSFKNKKTNYKNDYKIPLHLQKVLNKKFVDFEIKKPILAFSKKLNSKSLDLINEKKAKLNSYNFLKKYGLEKKIRFHNLYLVKIEKKGKKIKLTCKNQKQKKIFFVNKVILATGTIATTKIIMNYLKIKNEVQIKHHPRLISVYLGRKNINTPLQFTPSIMQIIGKIKKAMFTIDLRPGNKFITESIAEISKFLIPFKFIINLFKNRLIFSNVLIDPKFSNLFIKKVNNKYLLYSKNKELKKTLKNANYKIFSFLVKNKIIFPFYKTYFPGTGSDYHYFGTIPINKKKKLSVNDNCQLYKNKNIYIIDGSVFNFKKNKYPLGIIMANARRIGQLLSK